MKLSTERLELIVLSSQQLKLLAENLSALEKALDCHYAAEPLEGIFLQIVKGQIEPTAKDEVNCAFHSFWLILRKSDRTVIGSADFKDVPDKDGKTEIGYGLGKEFEHHGYMTETVRAMCKWALAQDSVKHIIAETERGNAPSQRILQRCGFTLARQKKSLWWEL